MSEQDKVPSPEEAEQARKEAGNPGKVPGEGDVPGNPPGDATPGTSGAGTDTGDETAGAGPSGGGDETPDTGTTDSEAVGDGPSGGGTP